MDTNLPGLMVSTTRSTRRRGLHLLLSRSFVAISYTYSFFLSTRMHHTLKLYPRSLHGHVACQLCDHHFPIYIQDRKAMPELLHILPTDMLHAVSEYLTGWDLFQLSHVNSQCLKHFSSSGYWNTRLTTPEFNTKKSYSQARSFLCRGLKLQERLSHGGGSTGYGALVLGSMTREPFTETFSDDSCFAMDIWFSLLDGEQDGVLTGGVLLGGQSPLMQNCMWTNHHVALMAVDAGRNLFCSLLDDGANCVATNLDFSRWYHLALSFNRGQQVVYLDGQVVSELRGTLHHSWLELSQVQVGTGFVSSFWSQKSSFRCDTRTRSVRTFCGWHNFHGVVDEFRVWRKPLSQEEIGELAECQDELLLEKPWYSLQDSTAPSKLKRILCTRPSEHVVDLPNPSLSHWTLETTLEECWQSVRSCLEWLPSLVQ